MHANALGGTLIDIAHQIDILEPTLKDDDSGRRKPSSEVSPRIGIASKAKHMPGHIYIHRASSGTTTGLASISLAEKLSKRKHRGLYRPSSADHVRSSEEGKWGDLERSRNASVGA
jgi:hypothetical protein